MPYRPTAVFVIKTLTVGSPDRLRGGSDVGTAEKGPAIPGPQSCSKHYAPDWQVRVALMNVPSPPQIARGNFKASSRQLKAGSVSPKWQSRTGRAARPDSSGCASPSCCVCSTHATIPISLCINVRRTRADRSCGVRASGHRGDCCFPRNSLRRWYCNIATRPRRHRLGADSAGSVRVGERFDARA